jgi:bifunctional DNA-binding transcriptional regulator/antitoxin component of YhaV-PrlF toxin-antitoxin module
VRITSKGQVTFPQAIHEQAGLDPRCEISFRLVGGQVFLEKVDSLGQRRADASGGLMKACPC